MAVFFIILTFQVFGQNVKDYLKQFDYS